ncbi:MAG TPA: DUF86 domain-containing protein [Chitinophagales bacterium]|nr:DUF86 domain-containing protein [Chitinophagales bacterium]HRK27665.1 DUF86 domain-containing protein [Chitinophagales bacterium]
MDECNYIVSVITEDSSKDDLLADETLKRAIVRSLEIIGEATKKISADFKVRWSAISWRKMAGMRDKLVHDYMGVNYSIVWDVVKNIIPMLKKQIEEIIEKENSR